MAVSKSDIKTALISLYTSAESSPMSKEDFADGMAEIIMDAIQSGDVVSGIAVQVSTSTGTGATTGTGVIV